MASGEVRLRDIWRHAVAAGCGRPDPARTSVVRGASTQPADEVLDAVMARYREPHRHYHTVGHLIAVVDWVQWLVARAAPRPAAADAADIVAAALFHDAIYDPQSPANESASADLARARLAAIGWPADHAEQVAAMVESTAHLASDITETERSAPSSLVAMLLDSDLAILGAEPADYDAYVHGVRLEYAHLDHDRWRDGRSGVLRAFLKRPNLYRTVPMGVEREARARANLTAELSSLAL